MWCMLCVCNIVYAHGRSIKPEPQRLASMSNVLALEIACIGGLVALSSWPRHSEGGVLQPKCVGLYTLLCLGQES